MTPGVVQESDRKGLVIAGQRSINSNVSHGVRRGDSRLLRLSRSRRNRALPEHFDAASDLAIGHQQSRVDARVWLPT